MAAALVPAAPPLSQDRGAFVIPLELSFPLPPPWHSVQFKASSVGKINFLVGPNGSGKSRFISKLKELLPGARLLSTDRLAGMEGGQGAFRNLWGDHLAGGIAKSSFPNFKQGGATSGLGMDTFILLEERLDLRIRVEATLSHLFNRVITLEWDSGNLVAKAAVGRTGTSYRLDREECHGIKELLVMLSHLYNEEYPYLIIDEPELNLHPQFQAFFMQEVRRAAGDPKAEKSKKIVFLVTHSPFILDFKNVEDVKSVISFDLAHKPPRQILDLDVAGTDRLAKLVPRLNVHHKQLFFSDNPVFVEGILDAQLVAELQNARGVSMAGAGSCIIDAGGNEEVNHYLELCSALGKTAYFLYDLDSLFRGNLRACVRSDGGIQSFLASLGVGNDFGKYCGALDAVLTSLIDAVIAKATSTKTDLSMYLSQWGPRTEWASDRYAKGRVATLTAISRTRSEVVGLTSESQVKDVEGRLLQICAALKQKNIFLLPGGTLERYLPSYTGHPYEIVDDAKNTAVAMELEFMTSVTDTNVLASRYGELYHVVCALPSKATVDPDPVLKSHLSDYIHALQSAIVQNASWNLDELRAFLATRHAATSKIFVLTQFKRTATGFDADITVAPLFGGPGRHVVVTEQTNAGMRSFKLQLTR
jgi:hypothetical protein